MLKDILFKAAKPINGKALPKRIIYDQIAKQTYRSLSLQLLLDKKGRLEESAEEALKKSLIEAFSYTETHEIIHEFEPSLDEGQVKAATCAVTYSLI